MNKATKEQISKAVTMASMWRINFHEACIANKEGGISEDEDQFLTWTAGQEACARTAVRCAGLSAKREKAMLSAIHYAAHGELHMEVLREAEEWLEHLQDQDMWEEPKRDQVEQVQGRIDSLYAARLEATRCDLLTVLDGISRNHARKITELYTRNRAA